MIVLVFSGSYLPGYKGGGPIKTVKNLFEQVGDKISFKLITSDRDLGDTSPYVSIISGTWNKVGNASVFYAEPGKTGFLQIAQQLVNRDFDVIYLNSFFSPRFSFFPLLLGKVLLRQTVVLAPRGEFSVGALSLKFIKKRIFIAAFKIIGLHRRIVFQASSGFEAEDIRRSLGHGVDIQIAENIGTPEFSEQLPSRTAGPLKAVFVSRISPKKNLLAALEMLQQVQQPLAYDIYGPIQNLGIGWDLPLNNPGAFSAVLDELAAMPAGELQKMRQRVLTWAKNKFVQPDAIEANIALFNYAYEKK